MKKNYKETILRLDEELATKFEVVTKHYGGDKTGALRALIIAEFRRISDEATRAELTQTKISLGVAEPGSHGEPPLLADKDNPANKDAHKRTRRGK